MAKCLVTGGAGFIGSHLVTALVQRGDQVRVVDDLSSGSLANLAHLKNQFEMIQGSILSPELMATAANGVDLVFHLAAMVSVPKSVQQPRLCHDLCATGTLNTLLAAIQGGASRFIYSGTSAVYGDSATCPIRETSPLEPLSPYAAGKIAGEMYAQTFARLQQIETVRLRYFNVFGPRQDPNSPYSGVISLFISAMIQGRQPTILGDGMQSRDFVFVENVVNANLKAASQKGVSGRVYNVGAGGRQSLLELVEVLNRHLGQKIDPAFAPPRTGDVRHSQADITAATEELGYKPEISFDTGIERTLAYFRGL